jgi:hypothetical protein
MAQGQVIYRSNYKKKIFLEPELKQILTTILRREDSENIHLFENAPNPFNAVTTVQFSVNTKEFVSVKVINPRGYEICTLFSEVAVPNKTHRVVFNGLYLPSSVYFCLLQTRSEKKIIRMFLSK